MLLTLLTLLCALASIGDCQRHVAISDLTFCPVGNVVPACLAAGLPAGLGRLVCGSVAAVHGAIPDHSAGVYYVTDQAVALGPTVTNVEYIGKSQPITANVPTGGIAPIKHGLAGRVVVSAAAVGRLANYVCALPVSSSAVIGYYDALADMVEALLLSSFIGPANDYQHLGVDHAPAFFVARDAGLDMDIGYSLVTTVSRITQIVDGIAAGTI